MAFPLGSQAHSPSKANSQKFQISGTAVNALGGQPLAKATISIASVADRSILKHVITSEDGRFLFNEVPRGKYSLIAERRGFYRQPFESHDGFNTAIAVGPEKQSDNIVFRVHPEASIFGRVTDEFGDPIRNGNVMLFRKGVESGEREIQLRTQTRLDDEGVFNFTHLQEGTFFVAVVGVPWYAQHGTGFVSDSSSFTQGRNLGAQRQDAPDQALDVAYPITYYPGATESEGAYPITLHPGDRFSADMSMRAVPALHLRVPGNVQVNLQQYAFGNVRVPTGTSMTSSGPETFMLVGIAPGNYSVNVRNNNPQEFRQQRPANPQAFAQMMAENPMREVQRANFTSDGTLDLSDGTGSVAISGTVKAEGLEEFSERRVILFRNNETGRNVNAPFSKTGELAPLMLSPGQYTVSKFGTEGDLFIAKITATGAKVMGRTLEIKPHGPVQLSIVTAQGFGQVEGEVTSDDRPLSGAMVVLVPHDPGNNRPLFRRDQSDSDGTFILRDVAPGKYTVVAIENGWDLEWANPDVLKPYLSKGTALEVEPKGKHKIKTRLQ
jgi:hypothetical protein